MYSVGKFVAPDAFNTGIHHCCMSNMTVTAENLLQCIFSALQCTVGRHCAATIRQESGPRPGCCPLQLPPETCLLSTKMMLMMVEMVMMLMEMMMLLDTMRSLPSFPESLLSTLAFTSVPCSAVLGCRVCVGILLFFIATASQALEHFL